MKSTNKFIQIKQNTNEFIYRIINVSFNSIILYQKKCFVNKYTIVKL